MTLRCPVARCPVVGGRCTALVTGAFAFAAVGKVLEMLLKPKQAG